MIVTTEAGSWYDGNVAFAWRHYKFIQYDNQLTGRKTCEMVAKQSQNETPDWEAAGINKSWGLCTSKPDYQDAVNNGTTFVQEEQYSYEIKST
jgi:hypothetical protein